MRNPNITTEPVTEVQTPAVAPMAGKRPAQLWAPGAVSQAARDFIVDATMLGLAGGVAIVSGPHAGVKTDALAMAIFTACVLAVFAYLGLYRRTFTPDFLDDARKIVGAIAMVAMAMTFSRVLVLDNPDTADQAVRAWLFASSYVLAARGGLAIYDASRRRAGLLSQRTLVVGAGAVGRRFAERLIERPEFGLEPVAFLDDDPLEVERGQAESLPVLASGRDPKEQEPIRARARSRTGGVLGNARRNQLLDDLACLRARSRPSLP